MLGPAVFGAQLFFFPLVCCPFNSNTLPWKRFRLNVEERGELETASSGKDKFSFNFTEKFSSLFLCVTLVNFL